MKQRYPLVDYGQLFAALLVVLIHCGRLAENDLIHFLIKSIICRMAVPFFLILNGYFYKKSQMSIYQWSRKQIATYSFWTILYLPLGILYVQQAHYLDGVSMWFYPLILLLAYVTIGVFYHLWYFPALLTGMWLIHVTRRFGYRFQFVLASVLFALGACETYTAYLPPSIATIYQHYRQVCMTTRNGLFYSFLFLLCGMFLANHPPLRFTRKRGWIVAILCILGLIVEGSVIYRHQGDDKNFLFSLVPIVFLLTSLAVNKRINQPLASALWARNFSKWCFFVHPVILEFFKWRYGWAGFRLFGWTVGGVLLLYVIKEQYNKYIIRREKSIPVFRKS